jgi:hypothetical protein
MTLRSWARPHFSPGGGDAFVFYQIFGRFGGSLDLDGKRFRSEGLPAEVRLDVHQRARSMQAFEWFKGDALFWTRLQSERPELAEVVEVAPSCLRLLGAVPDPATLDYFRDVVGLITAALDVGGVAVFDPQILSWWSPNEWRSRAFEPDGPAPRNHVVILTSPDAEVPGTEWLHTRGMRKFGRPDLSVASVPPEHRAGVVDLIERFIELQAFGGLIPEGQEIRMTSLPEGMTCHHGGDLEDVEFNNVHVEIRWP